jgi:hypothetical protein
MRPSSGADLAARLSAKNGSGITLVGGFSARSGHGQRVIAERAGRARDAGSPLVFVELEVALNRPGEHAARRLTRLGSVDLWPMTDRARFVGSAADLTEYLAELAAHVDGVLFFTRPTSPDVSPASTSSPAAGPAGTS